MTLPNRLVGLGIVSVMCLAWTGETFGATTSRAAETPVKRGIFVQTTTAEAAVTWRGQTLIEKDTINYLKGKSFTETGKVQTATLDGWQIVNTTSDDPDLQYRKEVAVRPDRVELTVQMNLPAYKNTRDMPGLTYSIYVPFKLLEGTKWTSLTGYSSPLKKHEGELTAKTPDGPFAGKLTRWIAFEGKDKNIVFDLNPKGITPYVSVSNDMAVWWDACKEGEYIRFSFSGGGREWGGVATGKLVIFEGTHADYLKRHSGNDYWYFSIIPSRFNFAFGTLPPGKDYKAVGTARYGAAKGFGWQSEDSLKQIEGSQASLVFNAVASDSDNTFLCEIDEPGLYLIRVQASNCTGDARGPFAVTSNGEQKAENLTVDPGKIKTVTFSQWLAAGTYRLGLQGKWLVSNVSLQMIIHNEEDFTFHRSVWLVKDVYEPTPMFTQKVFEPEPVYAVAVSEIDLPPRKVAEPKIAPVFDKSETALPDQKSPNLAWRYDGFVGGMGPDNNGTFLEFDTPEKITRRLKELKKLGINVILINGFLARHCHEYHQDRVTKTIKEITRIAHELDMKVLDHIELTILWNHEASLRFITKHIDWLQQTINTDTFLQGLCPLNPDYRKHWFAEVKKHIDETNIDGIMIDEVCYHSIKSCGCHYCRGKFTQDTGLVMPIGENAEALNPKTSLLYKIWMDWRQKEMGDWWIEFRKEVVADRPEFCIMGYVCEAGILSDYDFQFAYDLFAMARGNDFVGTEIMSSNVMDNYRYVFSTRRLYNLFREEYASPVWGLVYHQYDEYLAYFGWALNNMLGQATWDCYPIANRPNTPDFLQWQGNMDKRLAGQIAETAIIFSIKSRNWSPLGTPGHDALGLSQILSDSHIPHRYLTDLSLENIDRIKDFRLVILPSDCCMSDKEIQTVRDYVNQGGTVLLTGTTGLLDAYGMPRTKWGFADLLNCKVSTDETWPEGTKLAPANGGGSAVYPKPLLKIETQSKDLSVLLNAVNADGKILGPACVALTVGKGKIIYCSAQLGTANFQREFRRDENWTYELNQPLARISYTLINQTLGDKPLNLTAVQMPAKVICTLWQQTVDGRQQTLVHLLNATGTTIKKGDKVINKKTLPAFPPIEQDLIFEVELPAFTSAYATSPDYEGHKPVKVEKISDTRYRVTVPKDALNAYAMVVLE